MRASPSISATKHKNNKLVMGNDGRLYKSTIIGNTRRWMATETKQEYFNKLNKILKEKKNGYLDQIVSSCDPDWGSVQYENICKLFKLLVILHFYYQDPFEILKIKIKLNKPKKDALMKLKKKTIEVLRNENSIKESNKMENIKTFDGYYELCKQIGDDLRNITKRTFEAIYGVESKIYEEGSDKIGIMCYILIRDGYIKHEKSFIGFDT